MNAQTSFILNADEIRYIRKLMWQLPKWDPQEAEFAERLEQTL